MKNSTLILVLFSTNPFFHLLSSKAPHSSNYNGRQFPISGYGSNGIRFKLQVLRHILYRPQRLEILRDAGCGSASLESCFLQGVLHFSDPRFCSLIMFKANRHRCYVYLCLDYFSRTFNPLSWVNCLLECGLFVCRYSCLYL